MMNETRGVKVAVAACSATSLGSLVVPVWSAELNMTLTPLLIPGSALFISKPIRKPNLLIPDLFILLMPVELREKLL